MKLGLVNIKSRDGFVGRKRISSESRILGGLISLDLGMRIHEGLLSSKGILRRGLLRKVKEASREKETPLKKRLIWKGKRIRASTTPYSSKYFLSSISSGKYF
jgi:hypothetical protein